MTAQLTPLPADQVAERLRTGQAVLVDIREPDEFAARHVKGAISRPLSAFGSARLDIESATDVVFTCKSGMRTQASCTRLAATVNCPAFFLEGGLDAWVAAGLPTEYDRGRSSN